MADERPLHGHEIDPRPTCGNRFLGVEKVCCDVEEIHVVWGQDLSEAWAFLGCKIARKDLRVVRGDHRCVRRFICDRLKRIAQRVCGRVGAARICVLQVQNSIGNVRLERRIIWIIYAARTREGIEGIEDTQSACGRFELQI